MYSKTRFRKSTLRSAVLLALSINGAALTLSGGAAQADNQACANGGSTGSGNFTMLTAGGYVVGGTNNVTMTWDGTAYTASSDYTGPGSTTNVTASSTTPFFGSTVAYTWTAHDIQLFAPGSYSFDVRAGNDAGDAETAGLLNVTVPAGHLGMHMLFNWNGNDNIDVFVVAKLNDVFGASIGYTTQKTTSGLFKCGTGASGTQEIANCLYDGKDFGTVGKPLGSKVWELVSIDGNANGIMGIPMPAGGPFASFNANFNFSDFSTPLALTPDTVCNPSADIIPDQFTFTDVLGAAPSSVNESNPITVSGLGVNPAASGITSPISITGGEYSVNDGAYSTTTPSTVINGDTVKVKQTASANSDGTKTDTTLSIGGVSDTYSVTVIDKKPAAFSFTTQTDVATSAAVESDATTIGGMDAGLNAPISITGGTYSINGGAPISTDGTVQNNDTVRIQLTSAATGATTTIATLTLGLADNGTLVSGTFSARTAGGINTTDDNFTMLDTSGNVTGGTNDVILSWDQQYNTSTSDPVTPATAHMELSSVTPFFGYFWTAHHVRVFGPGTYTIDTTCTTVQLEAGGTAVCDNPLQSGQTRQFYTFTVGANQIGAHMLFDWNTTKNIDVVDVWDQSAVFAPSQLYTGAAGCANTAQVWNLMSSDWDGDGQNGAKMIDGPFKGFSANFNLRTTAAALACGAYTPTVNVSSPSGAGGCSINPTPTNLQARTDWWLVAGLLAWLGGIQMRLKRKTKS